MWLLQLFWFYLDFAQLSQNLGCIKVRKKWKTSLRWDASHVSTGANESQNPGRCPTRCRATDVKQQDAKEKKGCKGGKKLIKEKQKVFGFALKTPKVFWGNCIMICCCAVFFMQPPRLLVSLYSFYIPALCSWYGTPVSVKIKCTTAAALKLCVPD